LKLITTGDVAHGGKNISITTLGILLNFSRKIPLLLNLATFEEIPILPFSFNFAFLVHKKFI
jgi:hypothetical protein